VNTLEKVYKCLMARRNILHGLRAGFTHFDDKKHWKGLTPRRTPMPIKIVLAGENGFKRDVEE
jgi:hypothetical protein